ncbi:pimeloyl-ACP methyl ester carboxylesterase [Agrobacterium larrymoorei]|uniref:Pimeloyl-ACP methyl ester carboxylesterase n=1 Tax=Agrobacterium larrymoorei TaxID=160699 RepID=A0AAJ2BGB0_9HYPH|nr:alpha/beta hydrolase [Agrobacterium larrymoorei]MDR6102304.1 pimeloyl-ACP methyl ester carboxylesterase [Agrobacterium larrymoorei]
MPLSLRKMQSAYLLSVIFLFTYQTASWACEVLPANAGPAARTVEDIALDDGQRQRLLITDPSIRLGTVILFPGGAGDVGVKRDASVRHDKNYVLRSEPIWSACGYTTIVPDTIDRANLRGMRSAPSYANVIDRIVAFANKRDGKPIFLLGTSQGAIAAANGAANAQPGSIAGVVLSESVSVKGGSGETVFDAGLDKIDVPALIVANADDKCFVAPPTAAKKIADVFHARTDVTVLRVSGGKTRSSDDCGSLTPHGYFGIEDSVTNSIIDWMDSKR